MTETAFIQHLVTLLKPELAVYEFSHAKEMTFTRLTPSAEQRIGFHLLEVGSDKVFRLVAGLGVRLEAIEKLLRPGGELGSIPTVGKPLHLLRPDKEYRPWAFGSESDLVRQLPQIVMELKAYALPFFDRFGTCDQVVASLLSDAPSDWFMASRDARDAILVADAFVRHGRAQAITLGQSCLSHYVGQMPKHSRQLRELLARIESQAGA